MTREHSAAERFGDEVHRSFDWEEMVRDYPLPSLLLAAVGGFVLARTRGEAIVGALSSFAAAQVSRHVNEFLGEEILGEEVLGEEDF